MTCDGGPSARITSDCVERPFSKTGGDGPRQLFSTPISLRLLTHPTRPGTRSNAATAARNERNGEFIKQHFIFTSVLRASLPLPVVLLASHRFHFSTRANQNSAASLRRLILTAQISSRNGVL